MNRKLFFLIIVMALLSHAVSMAQIRLEPQTGITQPDRNAREEKLQNSIKAVHSLVGIGNYDQAMIVIDRLIEIYGEDPRIINEKKRVYHARKDFASLKLMVEAELGQNPGNFGLICQLGEAFFLCDSLEKAESTWQNALGQAGGNEFNYILLANYFQRYGYYNEAASVFKRARSVLNKPQLFAGELSDIYLAQKNYFQATAEYLNLLEQQVDPRETQKISWQILNIYSEADKPDLIIDAIEQAIGQNPVKAEYYIILGDIYLKAGRLPEAFSNYKHGDSLLSSDNEGFYIENFVKICFDSGKYQMAVEVADYYMSREDKAGKAAADEISMIKAKSLAELGIYITAFEILDNLANTSEKHKLKTEAIYTRGEIYADKMKDFDKAAENFTRLASMGPKLPIAGLAKLRLAIFDMKKANFEAAGRKLTEIIEADPKKELSEQAAFLMAEIKFFQGEFEEAKKRYNLQFAQYPNGNYVNDGLDRLTLVIEAAEDTLLKPVATAAWYNFADHPDSAIALMKAVAAHTDSKVYEFALYNLALYYSQSAGWEEAINAYRHYLTVFENGVYADKVTFYLAELYYEKADRPDQADQLLNKLITDFPNSPLLEQARAFLNRFKAS